MRRTVPPSAEIQASIDKLLARGMVDDPRLVAAFGEKEPSDADSSRGRNSGNAATNSAVELT